MARIRGPVTAFWLLPATGLLLYVPAWTSASAPRNVGNLVIVVAMVAQHRGMALHWGRRPPALAYLMLAPLTFVVTMVSLTEADDHGLRAAVCLGTAAVMIAIVRLV